MMPIVYRFSNEPPFPDKEQFNKLLDVSETRQALGISGNLYKIRPYLHHVDHPGASYLYPEQYINRVRGVIDTGKYKQRAKAAAVFAGGEIARRMITVQEAYIDEKLTQASQSRELPGWVSRSDLADTYSLPPATISDWVTTGKLESARYETTANIYKDRTANLPITTLYIKEEEIRDKFLWIRPAGFTD